MLSAHAYMKYKMRKIINDNYNKIITIMRILHILNDGPNELSDQIIDVHSREYQVEVVDLNQKEISYEDLVSKIFSCDRVISW